MERRASVASAISEMGDSIPSFFLAENDDSSMHKSNSKSNLGTKLKSNKDEKKKKMTRKQSIDLGAVNVNSSFLKILLLFRWALSFDFV